MNIALNRRNFFVASAAAGAGLMLAETLNAAPSKTQLRKAMIGAPEEGTLKTWKAAGFDGIETTKWYVPPREAAASRELAESLGMQIHSVLFGWGNLNGGAAAMAEGVSQMQTALRAAQAYGAATVLYVPCQIGGVPIPEPHQLDIRFNTKSGHLRQVVAGNNAKYQKYIDAHNHAVDACSEGVRKLIPAAEKAQVVIAIENVWNNLWLKPDLFANFVASFQSPWVRGYFDIGNHVKYAPPQDWIAALDKLLVKCHVKDFKLGPRRPAGGDFCNIRQGSVDWPAVRKALDKIGYNGWMTIEGGDLSLQENSKRLDLIIAGK
ncbi:MAG: sugar phosphate isomerase/epimerase [Planctomycetaceae bacterium]|nr:sugar phosphate isomerase/epimerase [Planctomycetaceae bacterium]